VFFAEQSAEAIVIAVHSFEENVSKIRPQACRANAMRFTQERFRQEFKDLVDSKHKEFEQIKARGML
jgi:hypothetical protein